MEIKYLVVGITSILFLILIDLISAVALHIQKKTFDWKKLMNFLRENVVPYILIWGTLGSIPILLKYVTISNEVLIPFEGLVGIVWLLIMGKIIKSIFDNFKDLGLEIKK